MPALAVAHAKRDGRSARRVSLRAVGCQWQRVAAALIAVEEGHQQPLARFDAVACVADIAMVDDRSACRRLEQDTLGLRRE